MRWFGQYHMFFCQTFCQTRNTFLSTFTVIFLEPIQYGCTKIIIIIIQIYLFDHIIKMKQYISIVLMLLYWEMKVITA